jgi:hypothetical protein
VDAPLGIDGDPIGKGPPYIHPIAPTAICLHAFGCSCLANGTATAIATSKVFQVVWVELELHVVGRQEYTASISWGVSVGLGAGAQRAGQGGELETKRLT